MNVKLYSISECPYCNMVREMLDERGVDYDEFDLLENEPVAKEIVRRTGQFCVPVLEIDGFLIVGFDKEEIEHILTERAINEV